VMRKALAGQVRTVIRRMREVWKRAEGRYPFVAFSTGKDSLAMAAMLYEAVAPETPPCLYVHHDMQFPGNLEYAQELKKRGFAVEVLKPFLDYFALTQRGIGFNTLKDAWCTSLLVGTAFLEWLQRKGARSPRNGLMFRGISGGEYSRKYHQSIEIYRRIDLPCYNPLLAFTREDIIEIVTSRYGLPLNPIYEHMDRTYCVCCYTSDARRQAYSEERFPKICERYYRHVEQLLFDSGLVVESESDPYSNRPEKLHKHGFAHWHRKKAQDIVGAARRLLKGGALSYRIRDADWIAVKHLSPLAGRWLRKGHEIRFWNVLVRQADVMIKRMINCLDCGYCVVQCFSCRRFDRKAKKLTIEGCVHCGRCTNLKFCMGWRHRFWRRVIKSTG